ncbi:hypothetical protein HK101_003974, partial [Irineochytrium annulatum]
MMLRVPAADAGREPSLQHNRREGGTAQSIEPKVKLEMFSIGCKDEFRFCQLRRYLHGSLGQAAPQVTLPRDPQILIPPSRTRRLCHRFHTVNYRLIHSAGQPVTLDPLLVLGNDMDVIPFADLPAVDAIPALTSAVADHAELHLIQIMDATVMRGSTLPTFDALSARATAVREEVSRFIR